MVFFGATKAEIKVVSEGCFFYDLAINLGPKKQAILSLFLCREKMN
jgi:hypothetical protein